MEDLIPFLIVVVISIVGAATRKKKKHPIADNYSERESVSPKDDFLSWMERVSGEDNDEEISYKPIGEEEEVLVEAKPVPVFVEEKFQNTRFSNYSGFISPDEKKEMVEKEGKRVGWVSQKTVASSEIKENEIGTENLKNDFDLHQAVIYSEILNRKYT